MLPIAIQSRESQKSAQLWYEHKFTSRHIHHVCTVDGCCCNSKQIEREIIQNVIVFFSCLCLFSSLYREQSWKKERRRSKHCAPNNSVSFKRCHWYFSRTKTIHKNDGREEKEQKKNGAAEEMLCVCLIYASWFLWWCWWWRRINNDVCALCTRAHASRLLIDENNNNKRQIFLYIYIIKQQQHEQTEINVNGTQTTKRYKWNETNNHYDYVQ